MLLAEAPELPQVACFDTAFHRTLPQVEQMLPLPYALWERGIRRYGFHGLSYEYMAIALAERHGDAARGRTIVAHLGSGASLCAMHGLQSVATTMGFSALDGLMMGTRCGALDPGVLLYLMEIDKLDAEQLTRLLYHESGLLGVSGSSSSPKHLLAAEADESAGTCRRWTCTCAASCARSARWRPCSAGSTCWPSRPASASTAPSCASASAARSTGWACRSTTRRIAPMHDDLRPASRVRVAVEPTNEEWIAASHAQRALRGAALMEAA